MAGYCELEYAVYFNHPNNPHITTHKIKCSHVRPHSEGHKHDQGGWGYFAEKHAAEQFAQAISKHLKMKPNPCKYCQGF